MVNFSELNIQRIVMHEIKAKLPDGTHAIVNHDNSLIELESQVIELLKKRLVSAAGKRSKAFELTIDNTSNGSFFDLCKELKLKNDVEFLQTSNRIADLLAISQTSTNIPGGYLIIIDSLTPTNKRVYIIIKAELHEALTKGHVGNHTKLDIINDIFLSPSQKLYKIGVIYERDDDSFDFPNNEFTSFLFDDQFRLDSKPAEYFYKDFLGFSISSNSKIQSKKFYEDTVSFIKQNIPDFEKQNNLLTVLKHEFVTSREELLRPQDFANRYFEDDSIRDLYDEEVANYLSPTFYKDDSLLKSQLQTKKINFKDKIVLVGPDNIFDINVKIISNIDELTEINLQNTDYTFLRIKGKPF